MEQNLSSIHDHSKNKLGIDTREEWGGSPTPHSEQNIHVCKGYSSHSVCVCVCVSHFLALKVPLCSFYLASLVLRVSPWKKVER